MNALVIKLIIDQYALLDSTGKEIARTSGLFNVVTETKHATVLANAFVLLAQAREVWVAQKAYFKTRDKEALIKSRQLEKEFDRLLLSLDVIRISDLSVSPAESVITELEDIAGQLDDIAQLRNARAQLRTLINDLRGHVGVSLADTPVSLADTPVQPLILE